MNGCVKSLLGNDQLRVRQLCRQNCLLSSPHQLAWLRADRSRNGNVLGHIEPPFLGLVLRHEGLTPTDAGREFDLCDTGILARLDERLEQGLVEVGLR